MKITEEIKKIIVEALQNLKLPIIAEEIKIEHPSDVNFGDYSTNIAMSLAKSEKKNPKELAEAIKCEISNIKFPILEKVEVAGAGFINFYLKPEFLIKKAEKINFEIEFKNKLSEHGKGKTMVIDYSAPNIAKPFGIGHLRSTDIGQAIYNIYHILGWKCIGDNHIGDWGTQYGKLMVAIKKWNEKDLDDLTIEDLEKLYVKFHKEAETDEKLIDEGRNWFTKLENNDKEAKEIWQKCIDISVKEFDKVYRTLGVKIDFTHGESFYQDKLKETIKAIESRDIVKKSEGAKIIEFEDPRSGGASMPPAMIEKSNGTTTYFTRDMATIIYRMENWKPDLIIYEVGADQQLHFKQLFKTVNMLGWAKNCDLVHVAHGLIRWSTGKFSTRKGETIHLSDIIEKARESAKKIAEKSVVDKNLTATEKEEMIEAVAIGAIKFSDLGSDPRKDIIFDWEQVMSLDGDSGPYLQYTYARCKSVLNKTQIKEQKDIGKIPDTMNQEEIVLLKNFYRFEEKIIEASERFSPAVIAEYLLSVARKYNEFYGKHRIIGQKDEVFGIFLTRTTASILEIGLNLLGIKTVEKM